MAAMSEFSFPPPRRIDHCVLPVADLGIARRRLTSLGFLVAPDGAHPFGTANCCVYLADGTFLEPLAQADDRDEREAARRGNMFTARDLAYRYRNGEEGFSALVFDTEDAAADHAEFVEAGFSGGNILDFSRGFTDASGKTDKASFRLAFAADWRAPDCFFFTCQRVRVPVVDRSALQRHGNGATRIKGIVLAGPHGSDFADFVLTAANVASAEVDRGATRIKAENAVIELLEGRAMKDRFGVSLPVDRGPADRGPADQGLRLHAIRFGVREMGQTEALLRNAGIIYEKRDGGLVVHPAPGQGAIFVFEAE
jgi:hypothetical protein